MQRSIVDSGFARPRSDSLADLLERVLDKGVVVAGDIVVNVLDIELLTLKVRLLICSVDTAQQMGIDWWKSDPFFTGQKSDDEGRARLEERIERLEAELAERDAVAPDRDRGAR